MRFVIVGAGAIGRLHASVLATGLPGAELAGVVDRTPAKAAELARAHGARPYPTLAAALEDADAVAVCTPSGAHADAAVAALDAGRHVLIEKPIDVSLAAARRIIAARRRAGTVAGVVSQHRFDPASQAVHEAVRAGRLGRISSAVVSMPWWRSQDYYDSAAWRGTLALDGGGALMNQAIHCVDLLVWLLGPPVEVTASTARLAHDGIEVEDTAVATLRFAGGALGVLHATTAAYPGLGARIQVHGDKGSAVIDADQLVHLHTADRGGGASEPAAPVPTGGSEPMAIALDAHARQYRDFLDAVATGRAPLVTLDEATRTLAVVLAVYESAATGRPVGPPDVK
jgi:UDP-N-acetyl-2-amino-2-deoxyglucuronate dehydrogenase